MIGYDTVCGVEVTEQAPLGAFPSRSVQVTREGKHCEPDRVEHCPDDPWRPGERGLVSAAGFISPNSARHLPRTCRRRPDWQLHGGPLRETGTQPIDKLSDGE